MPSSGGGWGGKKRSSLGCMITERGSVGELHFSRRRERILKEYIQYRRYRFRSKSPINRTLGFSKMKNMKTGHKMTVER